MDNKALTLKELQACQATVASKKALVGVDGFVDQIVHPVDKRSGPGTNFEAIRTISDFSGRIGSAAGKSANIELSPVLEKLGGNGPIMANAQLAQGLPVRYIGALGEDAVHPVFQDFAERTEAISLSDPGFSTCAEFQDGKIIFGQMASLDALTYERMVEVVGKPALETVAGEADLIAMVNWTMIPYLTSVFEAFLDRLLPGLPENGERLFFFDLADPEKRSDADLKQVLSLFGRFEHFGKVILGLNYREAEQVDRLLGFEPLDKTPENLRAVASRLRERLAIDTVVVHPVECAACATPEGSFFAEGPLCEQPRITTGAGDHFNAGFVTARLIGLSPAAALTMAVATSGHYVRTAESPSLDQISGFIAAWE